MLTDITVCIPSIVRRSSFLKDRALPSVLAQTLPVSAVSIAVDHNRDGAWDTRNRAMKAAQTTWIGFLDDDDELLPNHYQVLMDAATSNNADVVWGWFNVIGGTDPFPMHRGKQWDVENPTIFPITCLIKRELIVRSGAEFAQDTLNLGSWMHQDFPFWKALHDAGGKFHAITDITWNWYHHGTNTSGLGNR